LIISTCLLAITTIQVHSRMSEKALQAVAHSMAGALGGIISLTTTYPLFITSTRMQVQAREQEAYSGFVDAIINIVKNEGWTALFSGLSSGILGVATTQGVYYYWYELFKSLYSDEKPLSTLDNTLVASLAGGITAIATNPIWVINTRQQIQARHQNQKPGSVETFRAIIKTEGVKGLFRGVIPALILVSNPTIQYVAFERLKLIWERRSSNGTLSGVQVFILGALAKIIATVMTYPYIVVKSRLQASGKDGPQEKYTGTLDCIQKIFRFEGVAGFYKGLNTKIVQSVLAAAILFSTKEKLVQYTTILLLVLKFVVKRKARQLLKRI